ncbi:hypothetical protein DV736_g1846, partial [Chaetothyriales sp. CBS 134916]
MSVQQPLTRPDPAQHSSPSPSPLTDHSTFADSAISVRSRTPQLADVNNPMEPQSALTERPQAAVFERLANLAARASVFDDRVLDGERGQTVGRALTLIEQVLADEDEDVANDGLREGNESEELRLREVHAALAATVASMRQRQQEQHHLHQLTISKLEAVAQTCVGQRRQLDDLNKAVRHLRDENRKLGEENDTLRHQVADLKCQVAQNDVAVHAMSSAVSGLEGWINNSPDIYRSHSAVHTPRKGRIVVRGQGRFRGRYFVDDPNGGVVLGGAESASDTRELHDGVKSWLKGFRDVEEELHRASPSRVIRIRDGIGNVIIREHPAGLAISIF